MSMFTKLRLCSLITMAFVGQVSLMAAESTDRSPLVVNQWVRLEGGQPLVGKVVVPSADGEGVLLREATVAIVSEAGEVQRVNTDAQGQFSFANITPGIYSLTARGKDALSIVALHVVDAADEAAKSYPKTVEMPAAAIDFATVNMAIIRYLPPAKSSKSLVSMETADLSKLAPKVYSDRVFRVSQIEGGMLGRIYSAGADGASLPVAANSNVFITRDGQEVARTVTDKDGRFEIKSLPLGRYSLLTLGPAGLGLVGFELISAESAPSLSGSVNGESLVSQVDCGCVQEFEIQCAPIPEVVTCFEEVVEAPCCEGEVVLGEEVIAEEVLMDGLGTPVPGGIGGPGYGGGFGGGGGGFGGAGGGIGGAGGLLGLAAAGGIAAAAIAASDDDDRPPVRLPVTSPAAP